MIVAWLCYGCLGPTQSTRIVCGSCEEPDRFVRLQAAPAADTEKGARRLAHPFRLSPEDWKLILASVRIEAGAKPLPFFLDKRTDAPAFTPDEIDYLSGTLSKAFAQAKPEEWVVFGLSQPGSGQVTEMTTGGWFLEGEHLHLVLANYHCAVTMPGIRELLMNNPLNPNTGGTFTLIPSPHQTVIRQSVADRSVFLPSPLELAIAYKPLLLGEPAPERGAQSGFPQAQAPAQLDPLPPRPSVEERLQALKRLRDQGVLTEEEFRTKKKQLLDQF